MNTHTILIIEDNDDLRKTYRNTLLLANYHVLEAEDGASALKLAKNHKVSLILQDLVLPDMTSVELNTKLRETPQNENVVIIALSGFLNSIEAKSSGFNSFLLKPVEGVQLLRIIKTNLPFLKSQDNDILDDAQNFHLKRELERQININFDLANRCALQAAQLCLFKRVSDPLTVENTIIGNLDCVAVAYLEAAGVSNGLLCQFVNEKVLLLQHFGYSSKDIKILETFLKETTFSQDMFVKQEVTPLKAKTTSNQIEALFLKKAKVEHAIFIPISSDSPFQGILFLGSRETDLTTTSCMSFSQELGVQFGQSMQIAATLEQLTDSENRYRMIMENASCGIFVSNMYGYVLEVNEQVKKILQCQTKEIVGSLFKKFIIEQDHPITTSLFKQILQEVTPSVNEIHLKRKDGTQVNVEYSAVKVKTKKDILLLSIINDVTERNKLRIHSLLQDRLHITGTLMAGVAHEINNPIAWILSNLNYLKKQLDRLKNIENKTTQEWQTHFYNLQEVVSESVQGAERIRDIVHMFKNVGYSTEEHSAIIDIHETLNSAIDMASLEFKHRAILEKKYGFNSEELIKFYSNDEFLEDDMKNWLELCKERKHVLSSKDRELLINEFVQKWKEKM